MNASVGTNAAIRLAATADESAIDDLICRAERLALHTAWSGARDAQGAYDLFLAETAGTVGCVWGLSMGPGAVAHLRIVALRGG